MKRIRADYALLVLLSVAAVGCAGFFPPKTVTEGDVTPKQNQRADDMARQFERKRDAAEGLCPLCVAAASGILCVILDIPLERAAVALGYWEWYTPVIPIQNYLVWFATGAVATVVLELLGHRVRSRLPAAYLVIQLLFFTILSATL